MNPKLFGAVVLAGIAGSMLLGCRSGLLPALDANVLIDLGASADLRRADLAGADQAHLDQAAGDLQPCCVFGPNDPADLSGCVPITCVLI